MDLTQPEKIDILVAFNKHKIEPKVFRWQNNKYFIKKINLSYEEKIGSQTIYCFSVSDASDNVFDIGYHPLKHFWQIRNCYFK